MLWGQSFERAFEALKVLTRDDMLTRTRQRSTDTRESIFVVSIDDAGLPSISSMITSITLPVTQAIDDLALGHAEEPRAKRCFSGVIKTLHVLEHFSADGLNDVVVRFTVLENASRVQAHVGLEARQVTFEQNIDRDFVTVACASNDRVVNITHVVIVNVRQTLSARPA